MGVQSNRRKPRPRRVTDNQPTAEGGNGDTGGRGLGARDLPLTHASFFSGVGGLDMGLERAGWRTVSFSEIEPYANAVLAERWPGTPNLGDITSLVELSEEAATATIWSGGFPCQDLSVAGKRRGMGSHGERSDTRSGLAYAFLDLVERYRPPGILFENVPGLLTSHKGRDFGALLGRLGELGYWWAYRVLDAKYAGVPQRRRRVFVVALHAGSGFGPDSAAEVLSVGASCVRHSAAGDAAGQGAAPSSGNGTGGHRSSDGAAGEDIIGSLSVGDHVGIQPNGQDAATGQLVVGRSAHQGYSEGFGTIAARDYKDQSHLVVGPLTTDLGHHGGAWGSQAVASGHVIADGQHGTPPDPGGVRAADGLAGGPHHREELAPSLRAGVHGDPGIGRDGDEERLVVSPALRVGPQHPADGGPGDTVPIIVATLNSGGNDGGFRTEPGEHLVAVPDTAAALLARASMDRPESGSVTLIQTAGSGNDEGDELLPLGLDSHRYRCCGNGVVTPVAEWIGHRLRRVVEGVAE